MDELNQNKTSSSSYEEGDFYSPDSCSDEEMHQIMHGKTSLPLIEDNFFINFFLIHGMIFGLIIM